MYVCMYVLWALANAECHILMLLSTYKAIIPWLYRVLCGLPVDPPLLDLATISLALSFPQCSETGSTIYSFCRLASLLINVHLRLLHVASSIFFLFLRQSLII